ncbi:hypothetical protein [Sanguibacter massiliensis]|uniref:hypothetical protein n=1 Tax=Sanguibacter massiliensis TaxID=1973217 RepID=UPI0013EB622A|nr:hypothetical protein [Sanguibacter massiliensis]
MSTPTNMRMIGMEHEISVLDVSTDPVLPDYFDADAPWGLSRAKARTRRSR